MLPRRRFLTVMALTAASVAAPVLHAQSKLEKPRLTLALDGKSAFYYLPLTIAQQLGFFRAEGVDVEFMDMPTSGRVQQSLASGAADIGAGAFEGALQLQAKSQYLRSFVLQGRAPQCAFGFSTKSLPASSVAADLRGKKIGVPALGSSSHLLASTVLSKAGVMPPDVTYVAVGGGTAAISAVRTGQVDAVSHTDPVMTMLEMRGEVKTIGDARTLAGAQAIFGGAMPAACLYAPIAFVQQNPQTCQALTNAVVRALKWLQTAGPSDMIKTIPESYLLGDRGLYLTAFDKLRESISLDGLMPDDGPRTALRALSGFDPTLELKKIDLQKSFTNDMARRAKERFKA